MGHAIHFIFVAREHIDRESVSKMALAWDSLYIVPYDRSSEVLKDRISFDVDDWYQSQIGEAVQALKASRKFDVVLVEYVFLSKVLEQFGPEVVKIIDTHDVFANRHIALSSLGILPSFFTRRRAKRPKGLNRADIVLAIQDTERIALQALTKKSVLTLGHLPEGLELKVARRQRRQGPLQIGYLASANPINVKSGGGLSR